MTGFEPATSASRRRFHNKTWYALIGHSNNKSPLNHLKIYYLLYFILLHNILSRIRLAPCVHPKHDNDLIEFGSMKQYIGNNLLAKIKPTGSEYDIWDTKLKGFILRVLRSGNMVYRCEYARGKRITLGKTCHLTPMQARDKAKEILSQATLGITPSTIRVNGQITFQDFFHQEYEPWRIANRKNGKHDIRRLKVNFLSDLGQKFLSDISSILIEKWRTSRINKGIRPSTVNRDINILKAALAKAVEWEIISDHPLKNLKQLKIDSTPKVRYLSKDEEKALINSLKKRDTEIKEARIRANKWRAKRHYVLLPDLTTCSFGDHLTPMVLLSLNTGLRQGELFNTTWENINFEKAIITVSGEISKTGKTRHIPLNTLALEVILAWRSQNPDSDIVFTSIKTRTCFDNVRKAWANILKESKITKFRWHDMRHHFASKLVMAGVDLNTVRELLGHSDIKMTLRYAHLAPEHKAIAVERLVQESYYY